MAMGEGSASAVFAGKPHRKARRDQRGQGHVLAHSPIHRGVATPHGGTVIVDFFDQLVRGHARGNGGDFLGQALPFAQGNGGVACIGPLLAQIRTPVDGELAFEIGHNGVDGVDSSVQSGAVGPHHLIAQGVSQSLGGQSIGVEFACSRMGRNFFVHQWLREAWGILLVVAQFAKANDVHHHIFGESLAKFQGQLGCQRHRLGVVAIDVQHRGLDHFHHIGAIQRGSRVAWIGGGETDLVIDDDVQRPASVVASGFGQCKCLHHDTLASKGSITMHQDGQDLLTLGVVSSVHASPHRALHHGVHDLQV